MVSLHRPIERPWYNRICVETDVVSHFSQTGCCVSRSIFASLHLQMDASSVCLIAWDWPIATLAY